MAGNPVSKSPMPPSASAARDRNPDRVAAVNVFNSERDAEIARQADASRKAEAARNAAIGLADTEFAATLDPYLRNDPIARLGYNRGEAIGLMRHTFTPARYSTTPNAYGAMRPSIIQREVYGPGLMEDVISYGVNRNHPAIISHEMRHRGFEMLDRAYPEQLYGILGPNAQEGLNEIGDLPFADQTFVYPGASRVPLETSAGEYLDPNYPQTAYGTVRGGIQFEPSLSDSVREMYPRAQELALSELAARGETPQTIPVPPEPEGLLASIGRMLGLR